MEGTEETWTRHRSIHAGRPIPSDPRTVCWRCKIVEVAKPGQVCVYCEQEAERAITAICRQREHDERGW